MKTRLSLTVDEELLKRVEAYSKDKEISISELVEDYFYSIVKPAIQENIIDMVEKLNPPKLNVHADLKKEFYTSKLFS